MFILHKPTLHHQLRIFLHNQPCLGSFFLNFPMLELQVLIVDYFLHTQLQSATEQLSDEQQPASQEQSEHPEFPQLQPITKSAAQSTINFFMIFITPYSFLRLIRLEGFFLRLIRLVGFFFFLGALRCSGIIALISSTNPNFLHSSASIHQSFLSQFFLN